MHRHLRVVLGALLVSVAVCAPAAAQMAGGTISGTVTDSTQAVLPGVEVTIRSQGTGAVRTLTTDHKGFYSAPNLASGRYDVRASLTGFTTSVRKDVVVAVGEEVVVKIQLQVGAVTESTEVTAEARGVNLASSVLSNVVDGQTVRDLPINGRDWTLMAALEPGVHTIEAVRTIALGAADRGNRGWGTQMAFGGNRPQQNAYRLDGISINDYTGGGPGSVLGAVVGVDAIEEFSVITGNASAEYGKTSGGVINAVTRAGQNTFRGSAYEFLRNGKLDARNFFDGPDKPPFDRHQFGGAVGGPIRKDRTFFFVNYEGLRQNLSRTAVINVPSRAAHGGQLAAGAVAIDPRVVPFLDLFPLPNGPESGDIGSYSFVSDETTNEDLFAGRLDHKVSRVNGLRATFMTANSETGGPNPHNFVDLAQQSRRRMVSLEDTHIFRPNLVNIARLGYSHSASLAPISVDPIDPRGADTSLGFLRGRPVGSMVIPGLTTFLGGIDASRTTHDYNSYQLYDDLVHVRGAHSFKLGIALERIYTGDRTASQSNGSFNFGSLAQFLTNEPRTFSAPLPGAESPTIYLRQTVVGAYAQDDVRVRPNFTLNVGMRYEMATVPVEKEGRLTNLAPPTAAEPRLGEPLFDNPTLLNFSPRVGFTWDPFRTGKTAVRGGVGVYDTLPLTYQFTALITSVAPYYRTAAVGTVPRGSFPTGAAAALSEDSLKYAYIQTDPQRSYVTQWNLNVQRQLPASLVLHVGYVGQHGVHQPYRGTDVNIVVPVESDQGLFWPTPRASGTRLNPGVGNVTALVWSSANTYNGLNVQLSRVRTTLRLGVSYTWSKSLDHSSSSVVSNFEDSIPSPLLQFPEAMWGPSDFDKRHNLVVNYLWNVPGSRNAGARWLTGGWQLGGIFRAASGLPFTPIIAGDALGMRNLNPFDFPDRVQSAECENPVNPGNPDNYIKTECFVPPQPTNRLGNTGRNSVAGPGLTNLDVSLFKNNHVGKNDRLNVQLRAEFFNVLNHSNFSIPDRRTGIALFDQNFVRLPAAGRLTSTATTSRQIQFAVKVIF